MTASNKSQLALVSAKLTTLENMLNKDGSNGGGLKVEELFLEMSKVYASKDSFDNLLKTFDDFNNNLLQQLSEKSVKAQVDSQISQIMAKFSSIEEHLRSKLDCDLFDDEFDRLKNIITSSPIE